MPVVGTSYQGTETELNIVFVKQQEAAVFERPVVEVRDIVKSSSILTGEKATLMAKEQFKEPTQSITLTISPDSIRVFTDEYATANSAERLNSFSNFEESFVTSTETKTRKKDRYLTERNNGRIDVKTNFLGKRVCVSFDASADFGVTNIYSNNPDIKCDNDVDFIFEMKR